MIKVKDAVGREILLDNPAKRIVCLVPSISEFLWDLGLKQELVGRTKFCIFPTEIKAIPKVGGTKQVHFEKIANCHPDLIIANKEENTEEIVQQLEKSYPVYVSNVQSIHSAMDMMRDIGHLTGRVNEVNAWTEKIMAERLAFQKGNKPKRKVLYIIWHQPIMTIGIDTFIYNMLQELNWENTVYDFRYPEISESYIANSDAELILLSNEPYPFSEKHRKEWQEKFPNKKIILVDGSYFSWYGSRMYRAYEYFTTLL